MKRFFSEKNIVIILFVLVLISFSLAQEDSKKMEQLQGRIGTASVSNWLSHPDSNLKKLKEKDLPSEIDQ